jgi:hypothetical protein
LLSGFPVLLASLTTQVRTNPRNFLACEYALLLQSMGVNAAKMNPADTLKLTTELHPVNRFERFKLPVAGLAIHPLGIAHVIKMLQSIIRNDFVTNQSPPLQAGTEFTLAPGRLQGRFTRLAVPVKASD